MAKKRSDGDEQNDTAHDGKKTGSKSGKDAKAPSTAKKEEMRLSVSVDVGSTRKKLDLKHGESGDGEERSKSKAQGADVKAAKTSSGGRLHAYKHIHTCMQTDINMMQVSMQAPAVTHTHAHTHTYDAGGTHGQAPSKSASTPSSYKASKAAKMTAMGIDDDEHADAGSKKRKRDSDESGDGDHEGADSDGGDGDDMSALSSSSVLPLRSCKICKKRVVGCRHIGFKRIRATDGSMLVVKPKMVGEPDASGNVTVHDQYMSGEAEAGGGSSSKSSKNSAAKADGDASKSVASEYVCMHVYECVLYVLTVQCCFKTDGGAGVCTAIGRNLAYSYLCTLDALYAGDNAHDKTHTYIHASMHPYIHTYIHINA